MPALQYSKCTRSINAVTDNGRILCASFLEIYLADPDLEVILNQYDFDAAACDEVYFSVKDYLPRWYTDYVFECFKDKTMLKGGDPTLYSIAKAKVNSLYGMMVQKPCRDDIIEDYDSGEFTIKEGDYNILYDKYLKNNNSILLYSWGLYVTSYAFRNLFKLGACAGLWLYSDTDSCYGCDWDMKKVEAYNSWCKELLKQNNYGAIMRDNKEYWLGVVDAEYHKLFRTQGAKRYCVVDEELNEKTGLMEDVLKITVAGVPKKKGAIDLASKGGIEAFTKGLVFDGTITGKKTHTYFFVDDIYIDENGNETADSIDLSPCDYELDSIDKMDWEDLFREEILVQVYEEE